MWNKCKDRDPPREFGHFYSDEVLVVDKDGCNYIAVQNSSDLGWHNANEAPLGVIENVTHWMRIPENPDDDKPKEKNKDALESWYDWLVNSIHSINKNIEISKDNIKSQNIQNECFIRNEMELRRRIQVLEEKFNRGKKDE